MKLNIANQITILRIVLIMPFIICMMNISDETYGDTIRYLALVIFLIMGISDYLDGYFARKRKLVSSLGRFLDPLADKLLMMTASILLAYEPTAVPGFRLPPAVVVLIIGKDLILLMGFIVIYLNVNKVHIVPVNTGKFSTFIQLTMVTAILIAPEMSKLIPYWIYILKLLWWTTALMAILATFVYIRAGIKYIEQNEEESD